MIDKLPANETLKGYVDFELYICADLIEMIKDNYSIFETDAELKALSKAIIDRLYELTGVGDSPGKMYNFFAVITESDDIVNPLYCGDHRSPTPASVGQQQGFIT